MLELRNMNLATLASTGSARPIPGLLLPNALRILVLAPHPDDFDAIAVTLKFLSGHGNSLSVAVARTGSGVEDAYCPGLTLSEKAGLREAEQRRSIRFFGLPEDCLTFLSLANDAEDQPLDNAENGAAILDLVQQAAPNIVFLPHGNDTNSGHRTMYSLFSGVALRWARPIVGLLNRDPKTIEMRIDLYMPFDRKEAEWKAELLRFHDSQQQRNLRTRGQGFDERILNLNRKTAQELSLTHMYAEAFEVRQYCGIEE